MSWRDRDYARLRQDELAELYGYRPPARGRAVSTRVVVWTLTTFVCVLFFAFVLTHRESGMPAPPPVDAPTLLYGDAVGADAVCTEYQYFQGQGWLCTVATVNSAHLPVYPAARYRGPCAHLRVVDRSWACLDTQPAVPVPPTNS